MTRNYDVTLTEKLKTGAFAVLERLYFGCLMKRVTKELKKESRQLAHKK